MFEIKKYLLYAATFKKSERIYKTYSAQFGT